MMSSDDVIGARLITCGGWWCGGMGARGGWGSIRWTMRPRRRRSLRGAIEAGERGTIIPVNNELIHQ